jgi:hypothetical protein
MKILPSIVALLLAGCAVRLGGPGPEEYRTVALQTPESESAEAVASRLTAAGADIVLLSSTRDSAWFADVAARAGLALSGPGRSDTHAMGFLTRRLELLGDTSIVLGVNGGGRIHMHDALYQIERGRHMDLMLVQFDAQADLREAVRTLLSYVASDVGANAAIVFGLDAPTQLAADSAAVLLRAAYANAWECVSDGDGSAPPPIDVRLFYGPSVRMNCEDAEVLSASGNPIAARLVVLR